MKLTNINIALKEAYEKGYKVYKNGKLISKFGKINPFKRGKGKHIYYAFTVISSVGKKIIKVHRLQAYQKFGEKMFKKGIMVRHLDGNSLNNNWKNIDIGTAKDNAMDRPKRERITHAKIAANVLRILSDKEAEQLKQDRKNGMKYKELMSNYKLAKSTVSYIVNNKTYKVA